MERNFSGLPEVTPEDVMRVRLERGDSKLSEYMEWLIGDRSWDMEKNSDLQKEIEFLKTQIK